MQPGAHSKTTSPECCIWKSIVIQEESLNQMAETGVVGNWEISIELLNVAKRLWEDLNDGHCSKSSKVSVSSKAGRHFASKR